MDWIVWADHCIRKVANVCFCAGFLLLLSCGAFAQVPSVDVEGLPVEPLIGDEFCVDTNFSNASGPTGYGPYLVVIVEPGLTNTQADFVDIPPQTELIGEFGPDGQLVDPVSGETISGEEGQSAYLIRYPVGSVAAGAPPLTLTTCTTLLPDVEIGSPLDVTIIPGFEFGDTATGDNGPILGVGDEVHSTVTPQLARVKKDNTAPEDERPPGPSHPFDYVWTVDISDQISIENIILSDTLAGSLQWTGGPINVSAPLGTNCAVTTEPNSPGTPGGGVVVECDSVTGGPGEEDIVVSVPVYITDILDESSPDSQLIANTVALAYDYQGQPFDDSDDSDVLALHAAIQKSVSEASLPGDTVDYAINFQVTDYNEGGSGANSFIITDILPDGVDFLDTLELVIGGATFAVSAEVSPDTPSPGETTLVWDVGAAAGGLVENSASGVLRYQAEIRQDYADGTAVSASDSLVNEAELAYTLDDGGSGGNGTSAEVLIPPNVPEKIILDPGDGSELFPGQDVTFRLTMDIPAGKTRDLVFLDILPLPVFYADDAGTSVEVVTGAGFHDPAQPPTVTADSASNTVEIDFGDIVTATSVTIGVDITVTVTEDPFADGLFLTNILEASYSNSEGTITQLANASAMLIGAPELQITKGVLDPGNPDAELNPANGGDPAAELIDSNAFGVDAGDTVTYVLTVENIGSQSAYNVMVTDPDVAGMSCANPGAGDVTNGDGDALAFTGDLQTGLSLTDPLAGNDDNPAGGGAPFSDDTALIEVSCTLDSNLQPAEQLLNTASATWTATTGAGTPFPAVEDSATVEVAQPALQKDRVAVQPGYSGSLDTAQIGEIVTYTLQIRVPEGQTSTAVLTDTLDAGLAFVDVLGVTAGAGLATSEGSFTDVANNATIGASGGGGTGPDRVLTLDFGTLTNGNTDNATPDIVTVQYRARVLNAAANVAGTALDNRASLAWVDAGSQPRSTQVSATPLSIIEPQLQIDKTVTPGTGDTLSSPQVSITIEHAGASNADAFNLAFEDIMPAFGGTVLMPINTGSVATSGTCPDTLNVTADSIGGNWTSFPQGAACTIAFSTEIFDDSAAGVTLNNCANVQWESLSDADQPLDSPPGNTLGWERTGNTDDPGELNDYLAEDCATFKLNDVGIAKSVVSTTEPQTDNLPGTPAETEALAIGEEVTFELAVTVPESTVFDLTVSDLLPTTEMVLEMVSAQHVSDGADIFPQGGTAGANNLNPTVSGPSDSNGDGVADSIALSYGDIDHDTDGTTDENDRIRIQVVARVLDRPENANGDLDQNTATASYQITEGGDRSNQSDTYGIELVEPLLAIEKTADVTEVEAGDAINYTLRIAHTAASRVDAQNLSLGDVLPPELSLAAGSLEEVAGQCAASPDSLDEGADQVSGTWSSFPLGAVCELTFQATVEIGALSGGTVTNEAEIAWTSLMDPDGDEGRGYQAADTWDVELGEPGLSKAIVDTDSDDTSFTPGEPVTALTIGETVTFRVEASMPDGTTRDVTITDVIPSTDVRLLVQSTELVSIGGDLSLSGVVSEGDPASCTSGDPAYTEQCIWELGDVVNEPDTRGEPDLQDRLVFEVVATVIDDPANSGVPGVDDDISNTARLDSPDAELTARAVFDIVEPLLSIDKFTENGSEPQAVNAGEEHRFTLEIGHTADSTATARSLVISDLLDTNMLWRGNVSSDCPALQTTSDPGLDNTGTVTFEIDSLPVTLESCQISFDIQISPAAPSSGEFPNTVDLAWESAPEMPFSRTGDDNSEAVLFNLLEAYIHKEVVGTDVAGTNDGQGDPGLVDATIGEIVEYRITAYFSDGTSEGVFVTDTLQNTDGVLEHQSGETLSIGDNIVTEDGAPEVEFIGDDIVLNYGTVVNMGDGIVDENDTIVYRMRARVVDDPANTDEGVLNNYVDMNFDGLDEELNDDVDIDLVEPALDLSKSFTTLADGVATVELVLGNTGTAPAYDAAITDDLDETQWEAGSVTPVTVPAGFALTESDDGQMLVTLAADGGDPVAPDRVLVPGENLTVVFTVALQEAPESPLSPIPNTAEAEATSLPGDQPDNERSYTATATDSLDRPLLSLTKSVSPASAAPGDTLTYTITLENSGTGPATNVVVTDSPDTNGEFRAGSVVATEPTATAEVEQGNVAGDTAVLVSLASLDGGTSMTMTYEVRVPQPYPDGSDATAVPQRLENQADAESDELPPIVSDDPSTGEEDDATVAEIIADPVMAISKDDQALLATPGETLVYAIDYGNTGNQDATGVVITDTVPDHTTFNAGASSPGWSCADASAGSVCQYTVPGAVAADGTAGTVYFAVTVDPALAPSVDQIDNSATITEDGAEFEQPDDTPSTDNADEVTPIEASPGLSISKTDGGIFVVPGQAFAYQLTYANTGDQTATGLEITETVPGFTFFNAANSTPGWSCPDGSPSGTVCVLQAGSLEPGESRVARFGLRVVWPAPIGLDIIPNTASITDDGSNSPQPQTDTDSDTTPVIAAPDMSVSKATETRTVYVDDTMQYTIEYANLGNRDATGVVVREVVPEGTVYSEEAGASTAWSCADEAPAGTVCSYDVGGVSAGAGGTLEFAVRVVSEPSQGLIINVVEIEDDHSNDPDPVPGNNNTDTVVTPFGAKSIPVMDSRALMVLIGMLLMFAAVEIRRKGGEF